MDLKKRLAQLDRLSRRPGTAEASPARRDTGDPAETLEALGMVRSETPSGPVWVRAHRDELPAPVDPLPDLREVFSRLGPEHPPVENILFLDTETTGLAGGTGTLAFLVGVSWWAESGFETRQFFLPGPGHEAALLDRLALLAADFSAVVAFNGASFDLPLLRTRARLNRREDPAGNLEVWDLLVPSRRLWGRRLDDCRQQTLEKEICGLAREDRDIDGSLIPQTYFDFLATGQPGLLPRVLHHNHRDMVGMGRLFLEVTAAAGMIENTSSRQGDSRWQDCWALGRICERRRDTRRAVAWLELAAADAPRRPTEGLGDRRFLGDALRIIKRGGDWELVQSLIHEGLGVGVDEPWLHREAAILYEHRLVDLPRALDHAVKSGEDNRCRRLERFLETSTRNPESETGRT